jgi:hypothetical protein
MIHYILLSCLLSCLGGAIYFGLLRQRLQVLHAKYTILAVIVLSWIIPLLVPSLPNYTAALEEEYLFDYSLYNQWNVVNIEDQTLVACYEQATDSKQQCHCEIEQQSEIVAYQYNPYYNAALTCKAPLFWFFVAMMGLFALDILLKLSCLLLLIAISPREKRRLADTDFWLLSPNYKLPLAISSFTLWSHYVVWTPALQDHFEEKEIEAILLHEVAHLRQRDTWQQFLLYSLRMVWWMQPMYYWFRQELDRLNEYVADDFAVQHTGDAKGYAKILIRAKELQIQHEKMSLALAFAKGLFRQRVVRLVQTSPRTSPNYAWASALIVGALFWATSMIALPFLQGQEVALRQYEVLQQQNTTTGKTEFCKSCLVDELKKDKVLVLD